MKKILIILLVSFLSFNVCSENINEVKILVKIDNQIITNIDIENEINYLKLINEQIKNIKYDDIKKFAMTSLQREIIKKKEILKFYDLDQKSSFLKESMESLYKRLGLNSQKEFETYLYEYNLKFEDVRKKLEIEIVWNEMIYNKYQNQLNIDIDAIKKKINEKTATGNSYQLSEILFQIQNKEQNILKYKEIIEIVNKNDFNTAANIFSISDTSKNGGDIGWISEIQLSNNINEKLKDVEIGGISEMITVPGGILLLKVNDKKKENIIINKENELKKIIAYEKNKQFSQFSLIFYNRLKFNSKIDEK
jgi:peptidyl-prolyl cis-trans isomerase SurA